MDNRGPDADIWAECHDLLHRPFTRGCRETPGGWPRHLRHWWYFVAWAAIGRHLVCRFGLHHRVPTWTVGDDPIRPVPAAPRCLRCGR